MTRATVTESSGNVFADIGLPDAEEHLVKAGLAIRIDRRIKALGLNQTEAAKRMGLSQPDVSKMLRGHFHLYSIERLMHILTKLGQNVRIEVTEPARPRKTGKITVAA
jgi:predicted XRE-type DNA-binding protein